MIGDWLMGSPLPEMAGNLLRSVPGLPPILQTFHLLGVAVLMGSVVIIALRVLDLAARRQNLYEMAGRLGPWFVAALPVMVLSGLPFFLARPQRYLNNPVFAIKFAVLAATLLISVMLWIGLRRRTSGSRRLVAAASDDTHIAPGFAVRVLAVLTVLGWVITTLAGRWIAYADYLFWPG